MPKLTETPFLLFPGIQRQWYVESGHVLFSTSQSAYLCIYSTQFHYKSRLFTNEIWKVCQECTLKTLLLYLYKIEKHFDLENVNMLEEAKGSSKGSIIVFLRYSNSKKMYSTASQTYWLNCSHELEEKYYFD